MKRYLSGVAAAVAVLCAVATGTAYATGGGGTYAPADHTVVEVTGDAGSGFGIHRYDGTWVYPPTDSEAIAECNERDARVKRVRCRAQVRTWYRDLAELQQALRWAYSQ